jgi:polysaccharide export outer membrane protein
MSFSIGSSRLLSCLLAMLVAGCAEMPMSGPGDRSIAQVPDAPPGLQGGIQLVDVDDAIARALLAGRDRRQFAQVLGNAFPPGDVIGSGDTLDISIWEAPPATLFGGLVDPREAASARSIVLPPQMVDSAGNVSVPFVGQVHAAGSTMRAVEAEIARRLKGKANQPEAQVSVAHNASSNATVVGEVTTSVRLPLTAGRERVLDALAAAGGTRNPVNKTTIQVTRGDATVAMPLDAVIRDPRQNVPLHPGDVVTALFQPLSFTVLGATGKNDEVPFETQGITLAQALARSGGLLDARANAAGVYVFRFEQKDALDWPRKPVLATPDGRVPVIYRVNLRDPASLFVSQSFAMADHDLVYVSNAPLAEAQKFLNLVLSFAYPVLNVIQLTR